MISRSVEDFNKGRMAPIRGRAGVVSQAFAQALVWVLAVSAQLWHVETGWGEQFLEGAHGVGVTLFAADAAHQGVG